MWLRTVPCCIACFQRIHDRGRTEAAELLEQGDDGLPGLWRDAWCAGWSCGRAPAWPGRRRVIVSSQPGVPLVAGSGAGLGDVRGFGGLAGFGALTARDGRSGGGPASGAWGLRRRFVGERAGRRRG